MYYADNKINFISSVVESYAENGNSISLFLEGVPGSGKTALAKELARQLDSRLFRYDANEESNSSLMVSYDLDGIIRRENSYIKGPLWEAFDETNPSVMLIDEVDKSPRDFEAFLLRVTDEQSFRSPKNETISAQAPVVFVFTSNGRREMSPEFLRRCMRVKVNYPKGDLLRNIIAQETPFGEYNPQLVDLIGQAADALNGKIEPDEMPSPKELGQLMSALTLAESREDVEVALNGLFVKTLSLNEINQLLSFRLEKAIWKKI